MLTSDCFDYLDDTRREYIKSLIDDLYSPDRMDSAEEKLKGMDAASSEKMINEISKTLVHSNAECRCVAVRLLLLIGKGIALELVLPLLNDPVDEVRFMVCADLLYTHSYSSRIMEPLINVLHNDKNSDVRAFAAILLGRIGDEKAIPALMWTKDNDFGLDFESVPVSIRAEQSLSEIRSQSIQNDTP
jgi:hypothetical protein